MPKPPASVLESGAVVVGCGLGVLGTLVKVGSFLDRFAGGSMLFLVALARSFSFDPSGISRCRFSAVDTRDFRLPIP